MDDMTTAANRPQLDRVRLAPPSRDVSALSTSDRLIVFASYGAILYTFVGLATETWTPSGSIEGLWLLCALGLVAFRLLSAPLFPKPTDVIASGVTGLFLLWSLDLRPLHSLGLEVFRWSSVVVLAGIVLAAAIANGLKDADPKLSPSLFVTRTVCYRVSSIFGAGEIVFTPAALISIYAHHQVSVSTAGALLSAWLLVSVVAPLERLIRLMNEIRVARQKAETSPVSGRILRIDSPNIVRVSLYPSADWDVTGVHAARLADGSLVFVLPLFTQVQDGGLIGTGLCAPAHGFEVSSLRTGYVHAAKSAPLRVELIKRMTNLEADAELVGFVVEESRIGSIRFEIAGDRPLSEGYVVFCRQGDLPVFYQILDAHTTEESFEKNPRGTRVVTAAQLGSPDVERGFRWYPWVPEMNTPVFLLEKPVAAPQADSPLPGYTVGCIPGTNIEVRADFSKLAQYHTAVLGVTGMGKTEFVFDLIREGLDEGAKIFCVDFTGEYLPRLSDCDPVTLGLDAEAVNDLANLTEAVETGKYGGAEEKRALQDYLAEARPQVREQVDDFLRPEGSGLGVFQLDDIANSRATLRATEMYISEIFRWARENRQARTILLVLEEAHTVIPEANLFGFDKNETGAVVGRMAQIALQGRKYGVGLLLVSQRTALVSKTVLSQCNTCFSFALVDKTSLDYLENVFSRDHVRLIPNLQPRQIVAFGKGVHTDRPVVVEIPYDVAKAAAADALTQPLVGADH